MRIPHSRIPNLTWPAIPSENAALMMAMQFQLMESQWWNSEQIETLQLQQLERLLVHAAETVPFYRQSLSKVKFPLTRESFQCLPILDRDELQERQAELVSDSIPKDHGSTFEKKTSGSTGRQLKVIDTDANHLLWMSITLRDHLWHNRDLSGLLISIRSGRGDKDPMTVKEFENWGASTGMVYPTGPSMQIYHTMPPEKQAELIYERQPAYMLLYPSNAARLCQVFERLGLSLSGLKGLITYGELCTPEVREKCQEVWGVGIADMVSCEEAGYIALQCPEHGNYHCQNESVLVEVLDEHGRQCGPGEIGRMVLTSLHNFAMPLIRYANRDYAEVGPPCPCGRGGLVLRRMLGRARNQAMAPDGSLFWPHIDRSWWSTCEGIDDIQFVQLTAVLIELRIVGQPLPEDSRQRLAEELRSRFDQPYEFAIRHVDNIQRHDNGKYERFIGLALE